MFPVGESVALLIVTRPWLIVTDVALPERDAVMLAAYWVSWKTASYGRRTFHAIVRNGLPVMSTYTSKVLLPVGMRTSVVGTKVTLPSAITTGTVAIVTPFNLSVAFFKSLMFAEPTTVYLMLFKSTALFVTATRAECAKKPFVPASTVVPVAT